MLVPVMMVCHVMKPTLSPHIVLLAHLRITNEESLTNLQIAVSLIVRQNRVSGSHVNGFGICNRILLALNLYGCGGCCIMLYAMILLGCTTYSSPVFNMIWWIKPFPDRASKPLPVAVVLPQCARLLIGQSHSL